MSANIPLLATEIALCQRSLEESIKPGEPVSADTIAWLADQLRLVADMAARQDREVALHRDLMDENHARKIAAALGAHKQPETMQ